MSDDYNRVRAFVYDAGVIAKASELLTAGSPGRADEAANNPDVTVSARLLSRLIELAVRGIRG